MNKFNQNILYENFDKCYEIEGNSQNIRASPNGQYFLILNQEILIESKSFKTLLKITPFNFCLYSPCSRFLIVWNEDDDQQCTIYDCNNVEKQPLKLMINNPLMCSIEIDYQQKLYYFYEYKLQVYNLLNGQIIFNQKSRILFDKNIKYIGNQEFIMNDYLYNMKTNKYIIKPNNLKGIIHINKQETFMICIYQNKVTILNKQCKYKKIRIFNINNHYSKIYYIYKLDTIILVLYSLLYSNFKQINAFTGKIISFKPFEKKFIDRGGRKCYQNLIVGKSQNIIKIIYFD